MQKITVHTGRPYDILIDDGLLEQAGDLVRRVSGAKRICLICGESAGTNEVRQCRNPVVETFHQ